MEILKCYKKENLVPFCKKLTPIYDFGFLVKLYNTSQTVYLIVIAFMILYGSTAQKNLHFARTKMQWKITRE
jgi:hypothetical protein